LVTSISNSAILPESGRVNRALREVFVHLAYMDDSGSHKGSNIVMFGAVIVYPDTFGQVEIFHSNAVQQIFAVNEIEEKFKEFHASELFHGEGAFADIEKERRFSAIRVLLSAIKMENLPYIYAAVDREKLARSASGSAHPLDMAFRMCILGIEQWAQNHHEQRVPGAIQLDFSDMYLCIVDDTTDSALKNHLRKSYRILRSARQFIALNNNYNRLWHAHDDLYFGTSRDSVGIQMADLCNLFMLRQLLGKTDSKEFYEMIADQAICARPEPEWTMYRDLLRAHESEGK